MELDLEGVTVVRQRHRVVDDVSLRIGPGAVVVVGPNGSGKTTLLECIAGVRAPTSGVIHIDGRDTSARAGRAMRARLTGYAPHVDGLPTHLRVRHAIELAAWLHRVRRDSSVIDAVLDEFELADLASSRLGALSAGQRKRVTIAAAVVHRPSLLLLDEPTANLDAASRHRLVSLVQQLARRCTVVITTHQSVDVVDVGGRVVVLDRGRVEVDAPLVDFTRGAPITVEAVEAALRQIGTR